MSDLADLGVVCECGSKRLAPTGALEPGSLVICAACARPARVALCLVPVRWSEVEAELAERPHELYALRWHSHGVSKQIRRAVSRARRLPAADRTRFALVGLLVIVLTLKLLRVVFS